MTFSLRGVLPVSAINTGLASSIPGYQAKLASLQEAFASLTLSAQSSASYQIATSLAYSDPSAQLALVAAYALDLSNLSKLSDPTSWVSAGGAIHQELALDLAKVEASLALLEPLTLTLSSGMGANGLASWSYKGTIQGLFQAFANFSGVGRTGASVQAQGVLIITENESSWSALGQSVQTSSRPGLKFLGALTGGALNFGVTQAFTPLESFRTELRGVKANLGFQMEASLGLALPELPALLSVMTEISPSQIFSASLGVQLDWSAEASVLSSQIAELSLGIGELTTQLSAGGLALFSYSGRMDEVGSSLREVLSGGVPGGSGSVRSPCSALLVLCSEPTQWETFSPILGG